MATAGEGAFVFSRDNFRRPELPKGLAVVDVPLEPATNEALAGRPAVVASYSLSTYFSGVSKLAVGGVELRKADQEHSEWPASLVWRVLHTLHLFHGGYMVTAQHSHAQA
jgi:hypothetical protein